MTTQKQRTQRLAQGRNVSAAWRGARSPATLLAQMADLERGTRIAELRNARHLTQEAAADAVGITLRAYQEWEAGGGIRWENVKKLAKVFDSDPDFVMNGPREERLDLSDSERLDELRDELRRIESLLRYLLTHFDLDAATALRQAEREAEKSRRGAGRRRAAA